MSKFNIGHTPWNKGTSGIKKATSASFKKGSVPKNILQPGTITIRKKTNKVPIKWIRLEGGKWEPLSRYNWKLQYGFIPDDMMVVLKDGNSMNLELGDCSNLELITKKENARKSLNPEKAAATMRKLWEKTKRAEMFGLRPPSKLKSRLKHKIVIARPEPNRYISF